MVTSSEIFLTLFLFVPNVYEIFTCVSLKRNQVHANGRNGVGNSFDIMEHERS